MVPLLVLQGHVCLPKTHYVQTLSHLGRLDSVEWNGGLEWWTGMVDWNGGMERYLGNFN